MSGPGQYSRPLYHAIALMKAQMEQPDNVAKSSWLGPEKTVESLRADISRNLTKMELARQDGDVEEVWRRAVNVANFCWMIADRAEREHNA